jgi:hypothetical protein
MNDMVSMRKMRFASEPGLLDLADDDGAEGMVCGDGLRGDKPLVYQPEICARNQG